MFIIYDKTFILLFVLKQYQLLDLILKTGLPTTQYNFKSRALPSLTLLHSQRYKGCEYKKGLIKIVPLNIEELLTPIGLTH